MQPAPELRRRLLVVVTALAALSLLQAGSFAGWSQTATPTSSPSPSPTEDATGDEPETTITGVLRQPTDEGPEPVEGVELVARTPDGEVVGETTTDEEGRWAITVPGPGVYQVELITDTLPEGVSLRNPERNPLTVRILSAGGSRTLIFALGEGGGAERIIGPLLQKTLLGIRFGLIIAMTAVGLSLVFGTTGLINFAHGDIVTMGAVVAWFWNTPGGVLHIHLLLAGVAAVLITAAFSGGLEAGLFRPLRRRQVGLFQLLIVTIGLSLVIRHVILIFFGGSPQPFRDYTISRAVRFGPVSLPPRDMVIMAASAAILIAVATMLQRTRMGKSMRAVSDNRDLAESSGIDVQRVALIVWLLGGALAAVGGIFYGSTVTVDWLMGFQLLLLMFAGVILGGLGTAYGAMVGSIAIGIVTEVSTFWFPSELKFMWGLFVLIIVLLVRPQGILGRAERVG